MTIDIQLQTLPNNPGVYQFYDANNTLIYVGKAINLKKRVSSYFQKEHDNAKTRVLVKKIVRIEHIVVATESDALLLENNLIKKYQPRYNILLKDDKSYPWICVKKERFPRVFSTRRVVKDGSLYFGPYTSMKTVHTLLDLIKELFPLRNAKHFRQDRFKQEKIVDPERHTNRILTQMQRDLHLSVPPVHIECFDNSNIQGTNPVSACVVFKNAKPSKKDYRHFNVKTVEGPNDFASMEEAVYRRYRRLLDEQQPLPQLIIIDGGKGQLSSALKALEQLELRGKIAIIGIAKRLEEIYFPEDSVPLYLDKRSETLRVIQQLRDEAHRFGITFHRQKRSKSAIVSELDGVGGIGDKTKETLLQHFKSVKRIREATLEELTKVVGFRGKKVYEYFHHP